MTRGFILPASAAAVLLVWFTAACTAPADSGLPPPPPHPHGQVLWHIVHDQCAPDQQQNGRPAPCIEVALDQGVDRWIRRAEGQGRRRAVSGDADHRDHRHRGCAPARAGRAKLLRRRLARADLCGCAHRQDHAAPGHGGVGQFALRAVPGSAPPARRLPHAAKRRGAGRRPPWHRPALVQRPVHLRGPSLLCDPARRRRTGGGPFPHPGRQHARSGEGHGRLDAGSLAGETFPPDGKPGFVLLAGRADPAHGDFASGEELQDHECAIAHGG